MTKTFHILLSTGILLSAVSCGNNKTVVRADDYDSETIVDLMNEESPELKQQPTGRKPMEGAAKKHARPTPISGEWTIIKAGGQDIHLDDGMPYLIFSDAEGRFYASNGCNYLNGDYSYTPGDGEICFSNVVSTMADCPDIDFETSISVVLNEGVCVKSIIADEGRETYMSLLSNSGDNLLTLRRHNLEVANGQWDVVSIDGANINSDELNIFLDIPELKIHGNTGCNFFNGSIEIDPEEPSAIAFTQMGVTMRMCENSELERKMLVALEQTTSYSIKDHDILVLKDITGKEVMKLKRAE